MNVIFWDIDGVLNTDRTWFWNGTDPAEAMVSHLVERAARTVVETGAKCVLSSAWREEVGYERTLRALQQHGWKSAPRDFIGRTPYLEGDRGYEISAWLDNRRTGLVESYVIVDDRTDMTVHRSRLVHTNPKHGFTRADARELKKLLAFREQGPMLRLVTEMGA